MKRANWNPKNKAILKDMYNSFKSDTEIAAVIGTSVFAVARQRCRSGLVANKRNTERSTTIKSYKCESGSNPVIYFNKDGRDHYIGLTPALKDQEGFIRKVMDKQKLKSVVILKPTQIIFKGTLTVKDI